MTDVVLINPPYQPMQDRSYSLLGLPYIAANLEKAGYTVKIIDSDLEGFNIERIVSIVNSEKPEVTGISVLTHTLPGVNQLIGEIKKISNCEIVAGGPHITADPEMVGYLGLTYGIRGEADYSFVKLVNCILGQNASLNEVKGLVLNENNVIKAEEPFFIEDIDALSKPARHLIKTRDYRFTCIFSSRGCPYNCIYCAEQCRKMRYRSPEKVVEEIKELVGEYGIKEVDFADSIFTLNREHVLEICRLLLERKIRVRWNCITRADLLDGELLKAMKKSGCCFISMGVESGVERIRYLGGKNISDEQIRIIFKQCREIGLKTRASFLFGNTGETVEDMKKSIEFARELKPDYALFNVTQIFPGTGLFKQALSEGFVDENIWLDYMLGRKISLEYLPEGVSLEDMRRISLEAFNKFYLDGSYIKRKIVGISNFSELKESAFILLAKANVIPVEGVAGDSMQKCIE